MLIDAAIYRDGERIPVWNLAESLRSCALTSNGFLWIGLKDPDQEELMQVAAELDLHPLAVEDAAVGHQRPKLEVYQQSTFLVLRTVKYIDASSDVETGEVMVFFGEHFVVTVRRGEIAPLRGVRTQMEQQPEYLKQGPTAVVYAVLDTVVDSYVQVERELEEDLEAIEAAVFQGASKVSSTSIYLLKREVMEFRHAAIPLLEPVRRLASTVVPYINPEGRPFFRDVQDHLIRVVEHLETYDRLLSDALGAYLSHVSVQQNTDMRKISAWAAMAAFPTMLAGIYGMNFDNMPELHWKYSYFVLLIVMFSGSGLLYRQFKRSGWL